MNHTLVFIHGLESSSRGTKAQYFRAHFEGMLIEDYTGDFKTRMRRLKALLQDKDHLILVGSSYGGLMAARYALDHEERIKKLILIAPALHLEDFETDVSRKLKIPVVLYHGAQDNVVNPDAVKKIAEQSFEQLEYHLVDDDHPLNRVFPSIDWRQLLDI